jgi:hypothetical protein
MRSKAKSLKICGGSGVFGSAGRQTKKAEASLCTSVSLFGWPDVIWIFIHEGYWILKWQFVVFI